MWKQKVQQLEAKVKQLEENSDSAKHLAAIKSEIETRTKTIKAAEEHGLSSDNATNKDLAALKQERDKAEAD